MSQERQPAGVSLIDVTRRFGDVEAVKNVSFDIEAGEFVSLLGPSGCGKTTTLRMIAGFEYPDEGDITLDGKSIVATPPYRRDTSMVFQDYALFPHRSVAQNLAFGLRMRKIPKDEIRAKIETMLELVELPGLGDRKPDQLSGGQQQRVALGRALIVDPAVLLLDEPLGALDLQLRKQMQLELKRIHREIGITFIYVTHDQEEAITMSDRIAVMNQGSVEQIGPATEIYARPETAFVAEFIGDANVLLATVVAVGEKPTVTFAADTLTMEVARPARTFSERDVVSAVVRPENVSIGPDADSFDNVYDMEVSEVIFAGSYVRIHGLIGGSPLWLTTTVSDASRSNQVGSRVRVGWDAGDVVLVEWKS